MRKGKKEPQEKKNVDWVSEWEEEKKENKSANNPKILLLNYPLAISSTC